MTEGESSFSVPEGNIVATDPRNKGTVRGARPSVPPQPADPPRPPPVRRVRSGPKVEQEYRIPYPRQARALGIEGTVRVSLLVDAEGRVKEATVLSGPGFGLDRAAREALLKFRFRPAVATDGRPIVSRITYRYTFRINE